MTERIQEAIDIYLDALNKGTLAKGTCIACAIGNLVAHGKRGTIYFNGEGFSCSVPNDRWGKIFFTGLGIQHFFEYHLKRPDVQENIKATKFSVDELRKMEYAFETNTKIMYHEYPSHTAETIREDQLRGLAAVIDVMLKFDEQPETVEDVFLSKATLIPIL